MRRGVGVVLGVRGLVQHRHVVVQRHEDVLGHDGVQQAVEVNEEGDHLPGEVAAHLQHVPPDHARVVDLGRIILSCNKTRIEYFHLIRLCLMLMPSNRSSNIIHIMHALQSPANCAYWSSLVGASRTDQYSLSAASHRILQVDRVSVQAARHQAATAQVTTTTMFKQVCSDSASAASTAAHKHKLG